MPFTTMRAKFLVSNVESYKDDNGATVSENLTFYAVGPAGGYSNDGADENNSFAYWTPNAHLTMTVNNPALFGKFTIGQEYYADFTGPAQSAGQTS